MKPNRDFTLKTWLILGTFWSEIKGFWPFWVILSILWSDKFWSKILIFGPIWLSLFLSKSHKFYTFWSTFSSFFNVQDFNVSQMSWSIIYLLSKTGKYRVFHVALEPFDCHGSIWWLLDKVKRGLKWRFSHFSLRFNTGFMGNIQHAAPILETSFWTKFDPQNWSKLIKLLNTCLQSLSWLRSLRSSYRGNMHICVICTFKTVSIRW